MVKEKRILSYFLGWLIVGFLICFIGINDVFALNVNSEYVKIFDNYGTSLSEVTTAKVTSPKTYWTGTIPKIIANSNGGAIIIQTESPLAKGVNYSLSINLIIYSSDGTATYNTAISSKFNLGIGTGIQNTKDSYFNNTGIEVLSKEKTGSYIYYNFTTKTNGSYILVPFTTETSCNNGCIVEYYGYDLTSNGLASELSSSDITNITNTQTNELNNSIQNSTDTITGEIDDMEQTIVDSNKETQDVIKDQFNSCRPSTNLFNPNNLTNNVYVLPTGNTETQNSFWLSDYIEVNDNKPYVLNYMPSGIIYYDENKNFIGLNYDTKNFTTKNLTKYIRINYKKDSVTYENANKVMMNEGTSVSSFEPYGEEVCNNKIDETNDKLDNLQGAITDSSAPNTSGLENSAGWLPPGPLDSVLNLPLSLFNALTTNLNKSCNSINIPLPYVNKNITLPCINTLYNQIGITSFLSWIGVIVSGLMLYSYLLKLYKWIEDRISLNETHNVDSWGGL